MFLLILTSLLFILLPKAALAVDWQGNTSSQACRALGGNFAAVGVYGGVNTEGLRIKLEPASNATKPCNNSGGICTLESDGANTVCGFDNINCATSAATCNDGRKKFNLSILDTPSGCSRCYFNNTNYSTTTTVCILNLTDNTEEIKLVSCDCSVPPTSTNAPLPTATPHPTATPRPYVPPPPTSTPVPSPLPVGVSCTASGSCSGLTCNFTVSYYIGGTLQGNYRKSLYPDLSSPSVSSGWKNSSQSLSHTYTAGTYTARVDVSQNDGSSYANCSIGPFTLSSTSSSQPQPVPTTPPAYQSGNICYTCHTNGKWRELSVCSPPNWADDCSRWGSFNSIPTCRFNDERTLGCCRTSSSIVGTSCRSEPTSIPPTPTLLILPTSAVKPGSFVLYKPDGFCLEGNTMVTMTWQAPHYGDASSYKVYRSNDRVTYQNVSTFTSTSATDTIYWRDRDTLNRGQDYYYKVQALNGTGNTWSTNLAHIHFY